MDENEDDTVSQEGIVVESLPNDLYRVALDGGQTVRAHVARALRMNVVRILPGDRVKVVVRRGDKEMTFEVTLDKPR